MKRAPKFAIRWIRDGFNLWIHKVSRGHSGTLGPERGRALFPAKELAETIARHLDPQPGGFSGGTYEAIRVI